MLRRERDAARVVTLQPRFGIPMTRRFLRRVLPPMSRRLMAAIQANFIEFQKAHKNKRWSQLGPPVWMIPVQMTIAKR
jgi:hypothetical protein